MRILSESSFLVFPAFFKLAQLEEALSPIPKILNIPGFSLNRLSVIVERFLVVVLRLVALRKSVQNGWHCVVKLSQRIRVVLDRLRYLIVHKFGFR